MKIKNKLQTSVKRLFGALVLSGLFLVSPIAANAGSPVESGAEEGWTLIAEKGDVKAYAQIVQCGSDEQSMYLVKLVNINKSEVANVEYSISVVNHPALGTYTRSVKLAPGASLSGTCELDATDMLRAETFGKNPELENLQFQLLTLKDLNDEK